jgi:nicotinate phosphoribosyltransferase
VSGGGERGATAEETPGRWVDDTNQALLTDLYQLTMAQAYWKEAMDGEAVFSLFFRRLPPARNYLLACGLDDALHFLETARFSDQGIAYLATLPGFHREFLDRLRRFRFSGDVYAMPEGTPVFPGEPILEVVAPIAEAQLVETLVMNQVQLQTVLASKASRIVTAAGGRTVVDFGLRRMHGADAGLKSARAFHIAGVDATSNVLAGLVYGLPVAGTMGHSYIQAHDHELDALRSFLQLYPEAILLVDTYDTLRGVEKVIELARELGGDFRARGIRLDSGDLGDLAVGSRRMLDTAGLGRVGIFASGGLDEAQIAELVRRGAPINGFGVGTAMAVSSDAPALDLAYKLSGYAGRGRLKTSPGKANLPGQKQVFRLEPGGRAVGDVIGRWDEPPPPRGRPLLRPVMRGGQRLPAGTGREVLAASRELARRELDRLPDPIRGLEEAEPGYPVEISPALAAFREETMRGVG